MKKQLLKSALIAVAGVGLLAGSAMADSTEPDLNTVLANSVTGQTITTANDTGTEAWTTAEGEVDAYLIKLLSAASGSLYIYQTGDISNAYELVLDSSNTTDFRITTTGALKIDGDVVDSDFGQYFSFYWQTEDNEAATQNTFNTGGYDAVYTFLLNSGAGVTVDDGGTPDVINVIGNNDWILAFEDIAGGGDGDHQDAVFLFEDMNAVPEPTTMLMFGTGLVGLANFARRKKA